jgi:hypothetical protein
MVFPGPRNVPSNAPVTKWPGEPKEKEKEMRSFVRAISIASGILVLTGVQQASAQIETSVEFTTSFPFTVGNSHVPAGSYSIRQAEDNLSLLELSGGRTALFFEADNVTAPRTSDKTEVTFSRDGNGYVLKDIWIEGSDMGYEAIRAEGERHAAKDGDSNNEQRVAGHRKSGTTSAK